MDTSLLSLYLKLNLVLAASYVLWLGTKRAAVLLRFDVSHARQLLLARMLFMAVVAGIPLVLALDAWTSWFAFGAPAPFFVADFSAIANLDATLARRYDSSLGTLVPAAILALLLLGGLAFQLARLARQVQQLRAIVAGATEYKCIRGIHLLFSPAVSTPFSTQALGRKQVVLPYQLLGSPRNLRLAVKHELQHIRSHDLEWVIACEIAGVFFFWNPAMWLWHNEFDCLQEFACDEALVQDKHVDSTAYGNCLLEVASTSTGHALIASSNMVPKFSFWKNHHSQLKRRILMLTTVRSMRFQIHKSLVYALLAGLGLMQSSLIVFAAEAVSPTSIWFGVDRVNPEYPQEALAGSLEGWVFVDYRVDDRGAVYDVKVLDHGVCQRGQDLNDYCAPGDMFDSSTIAAVSKWRYDKTLPHLARQPRGRTVIHFQLDDDDK